MNVVQIGATFVQAQKQIESSIHHRLTADGQKSYILYAIGEETDPHIIKYETRAEEFLRKTLNKLLPRRPIYAVLQTKRLVKILKGLKPDLVHLHIIHHGTIDYPFLFEYLSQQKIPVVFTMHDMWAFTGGCYYFTSNGCKKYLDGCNLCTSTERNFDNPKKDSSYFYSLKKCLYEKLSYFCTVSVSKWTNDQVKSSFLNKYDNYTIYNAVRYIDVDRFVDSTVEGIQKMINHKIPIICVAGYWTKRKGLDVIIELANILGDRFVVIVVGKLPSEYYGDYNRIIQAGFLSLEQLAYLYRIAALHVSASLEETFGMTFIEAAMQGTRSVGFNSSAVGEILDLVQGRKVDDYSAEGLAKEINSLVDDGNFKLSDSETAMIRRMFSEEIMANSYIQLYKEILQKGIIKNNSVT